MTHKIKAGISIGDVNGVGMEVILKTFADERMMDFCTPVIYGSSKVITYYRKMLNIEFNFHNIRDTSEAFDGKVNLVNCWNEEIDIQTGNTTPIGGKYAFKSLEAASDALKNKKVDVLITAPINKHNIQSEQFKFSGHTEYLGSKFGAGNTLMIMCSGNLRVGVVTGHIPVSEIAGSLSAELIEKKIRLMNKSLKADFGIRKPKIAVLGLNPHAGDQGLIGNEEREIIIPAIEAVKQDAILAMGPYSADGLFGSSGYASFDGILGMYHDQGLIPFKALSFNSGVNYTAGLPVIRTSPDHGVAYDIAGKNEAVESSFREAVYLASDIFKARKNEKFTAERTGERAAVNSL